MARTKRNRGAATRAAVPAGAAGGRTPPSTITVLIFAASVVTGLWAAAMLTPSGRVAYVYVFAYAEYYLGVITLVALSLTIMIGLVATDRLVLSIRQRVLLQSAHRATGVIAVAALAVHVGTKLAEGHVRLIDAVVPFLAPGVQRVYLGLGTVAGLIMIMVMWTGVARARFVGRGRPWMWRSIHATSYLMWPAALMHGLSAGRAAAPWVVVGYVLCVLAVLIGLAVRVSVRLNRRTDFASAAGSMTPVGAPAGAASPERRAAAPARVPAAVPARVPAAVPARVPAAVPARPADPGSRPADPGPHPGRPGRRVPAESRHALPVNRYDAPPIERHDMPPGGRYDVAPVGRYKVPPVDRFDVAPADSYDVAPVYRYDVAPGGRYEVPPVDRFDVASGDSYDVPPDDTPTLVDMAARRARKAERAAGAARAASRAAHRHRAGDDGLADLEYWRRLRREAQ